MTEAAEKIMNIGMAVFCAASFGIIGSWCIISIKMYPESRDFLKGVAWMCFIATVMFLTMLALIIYI